MTLAELSKRSGVSVAMLSQIETDKVNPTLATIWKIADGFDIEINTLLSDLIKEKRKFYVVRKDEITEVETEHKGVQIRVLSPLDMAEKLEIYILTFHPKEALPSSPHPERTEEYITAIKGDFFVKAGEKETALYEGDFMHYHADIEHSIENITDKSAELYMVVHYK